MKVRAVHFTGAVALALLAQPGGPTASAGAVAAIVAPAAPRLIGSPAAPGSRFPNLTVTPEGDVLMSWFESLGPGAALRCATFDGVRWSVPATIATGESLVVNGADVPVVHSLGGGRWVAAWLWKSGRGEDGYDIRMSRSSDGGRGWSTSMTPHHDATVSEHGFVSLIPGADGTLAVWLDGRNTVPKPGRTPETMLRAATLSANGRLSDEVELDTRTCDCCPTAAVATERGVVVAYRDRDANEVRDISVTRRENGRWTTPVAVHRDGWRIAGCPVNGPALAASGSHVALAWYTAARDTARVYVAFSDNDGASFGAPRRMDGGNALGRVQVAWLDEKTAEVAWIESSAQGALIRARRVPAAGTIGATITVAHIAQSRGVGAPRMVGIGKGLLFAWTETGRPSQVRVARAE